MSETKSKKEEKTEVGLTDDGKERLEKTLSSRSVKALSLVLNGQVDLLSRKGAKVHSQNGGGTYHVTGNFCTCPDLQEFQLKFLHTWNFLIKFRDYSVQGGQRL